MGVAYPENEHIRRKTRIRRRKPWLIIVKKDIAVINKILSAMVRVQLPNLTLYKQITSHINWLEFIDLISRIKRVNAIFGKYKK